MDPSLVAMLPPLIGCGTAFFLFGSGLPELLRERRRGTLNSDPTPFVVMLISTLLWVQYSSMIGDMWLFISNAFGAVVGSFNTCIALRFTADKKIAHRLELVFCIGISTVMLSMMVLASPWIVPDEMLRRRVASSMCIGICLIMFASPCLQARRALATGDAGQISGPLTIAQVMNGTLWTTYGLAQGDHTIWTCNSAAVVLAVGNLIVKVLLSRRSSTSAAAKPVVLSAQQKLVKDALRLGKSVVVRSLSSPDKHLYVAAPEDADGGDAEGLTYVKGEACGSELQLLPAAGSDDQLAMRTSDGRYLQIVPAALERSNSSNMQPNHFYVVATRCSDPGPEGYFLPVYGSPVESDPWQLGPVVFHNFADYSVGFWNPTLRVFIRLNEKGYFDCSSEWNVFGYFEHEAKMPPGWTWERFVVLPAELPRSPARGPRPGPRRRAASQGGEAATSPAVASV